MPADDDDLDAHLHPWFQRVDHYLLDDDGEPVAIRVWTDDGQLDAAALRRWGLAFEAQDRIVLQTTWPQWTAGRDRHRYRRIGGLPASVSTVFLGLDHNFTGRGEPSLWESMIFGTPFDGYQARYRSKLDALRGHQFAVEVVTLYRTGPRRLKKTLGKLGRGLDAGYGARSGWGRDEPRRAARALQRLAARDQRLVPT